MKRGDCFLVGGLMWAMSSLVSCGNQVEDEGMSAAFDTSDEAFDACCDRQSGYRDEIAACAQYRDDNDLDTIDFCISEDGMGGGRGGLPAGEQAFSCDLDVHLSDGRSKAFVWSQDDAASSEVFFSAQAMAQRLNIAVDEPASPNWVARITLAGPPQMANTWSLPNQEVPYVGTNDPVERFELVSGTVEMTRCAGVAGEVFEIYIDATLQDLFGSTSGTIRGYLRSRAQTVIGPEGQFECPPI